MAKKLLAQGAESKLFLEKDIVTKHRFRKKYRISEIDDKLRGFRTRRESKVLSKLEKIDFPSPKLLQNDEKETIQIEFIKGNLVKEVLDKDYKKLSKEIGEKIAILHNNHIIHGDLTTSNMILKDEIYFIDFGLSFFSHKIEDKAVDLHVLKEALDSAHHSIWKESFDIILKAYKQKSDEGTEILNRLKEVEKRGRYKQKK